MSKHLAIEKYVPVVRLEEGIYTNYPVTLNGSTASLTAGGGITSAANVKGAAVTLTAAATVSLDPTTGNVFKLTPAQNETINAASAPAGQFVSLVVTTSGTNSYTLTFSTNFKTTGTLATGTVSAKVFTITFVSDGTNLNEVARTTAM